MVRKHVFLPEEHVAQLKALAKEKHVTMADLIRLAIEEFLSKYGIRKTVLPANFSEGTR